MCLSDCTRLSFVFAKVGITWARIENLFSCDRALKFRYEARPFGGGLLSVLVVHAPPCACLTARASQPFLHYCRVRIPIDGSGFLTGGQRVRYNQGRVHTSWLNRSRVQVWEVVWDDGTANGELTLEQLCKYAEVYNRTCSTTPP